MLFTDVQGSTELRTTRGDDAAHRILRAQEDLVREQIEAHSGREVKALGDGFMVAFGSARRAVQCAVGIQRAIHEYNHQHPDEEVQVRIGLNSGEVSEEDGDMFGAAVNAAARVAAKAKGGEVLVAGVVKQLAGKVPEVEFVDRGRFRLKGFDERWQLFQLTWAAGPDHVAALVAVRPDMTPLVARDSERDELFACLDAAVKGESAVVLLGGEPGVGKTRLATEVLAEADRRGFRTFVGRCYEGESTPPYQPFIEIVEMAAAKLPAEVLRHDLGDAAGEVARLMPELRRRFPDIPEPMELPPAQERRYLFNSIRDFIGRASKTQPVCVLLDDLQWADEASLLLFEHVVQGLGAMPVVVLGTYRDVELELGRPLARTLDALLRRRLVRRMALKRLDQRGVEAMLAALGGQNPPPSLVALIFEETEGNPFFVEEVYRHLSEGGELFDSGGAWRSDVVVGEVDVPESVRLVIGRRLQRLGEGTRRALSSAAVIGRAFTFSLLSAMDTELDEDALFDALDEAERAQLLMSTAVGRDVAFIFAHELIRQTLLGELSTLRRQRLHKSVADAIERIDGDGLDARATEIAYHLVEAGIAADPEKAARYLAVAGERALEATAFSDALRFFENALAVSGSDDRAGRARVLSGLGAAYRSLGRWDESRAALTEAIDIHVELGNTETVGELCYAMALALAWAFKWEECLLVAGRGLVAMGESKSQFRVGLLALSGLIVSLAGNYGPGDSMTQEAVALAEKQPETVGLGFALGVRAVHHWAYLELRQAAAEGLRSMDLSRQRGFLWGLSDTGTFTGFALHMLGDDEAAERVIDEIADATARIGHIQAQELARRVRAMTQPLDAIDQWRRHAEDDLARSATLEGDWLDDAYCYIGLAAFWRGDWDDAVEALRRAVEENAKAQPWIWNSVYGGCLFWALAHNGQRDEALQLLADRGSELPVSGKPNSLGSWAMMMNVVEGLVALGENERAHELYPLTVETLAAGAVTIYGPRLVSITAGIAAAAGRNWEGAVKHFADALARADLARWRPEQAEARRFYAGMLLDRGDPNDAEHAAGLLTEAIPIYRAAGMPRHVGMAEELLTRASAGAR